MKRLDRKPNGKVGAEAQKKGFIPSLSLRGRPITPEAIEFVDHLYDGVMVYRSAIGASKYKHKKLRANYQRLLGGLIGELLDVRAKASDSGWRKVSMRRADTSTVGVDEGVFRTLLDALVHDGLIERGFGHPEALEFLKTKTGHGRITRVRASSKLVLLSAQYGITPHNIPKHFSFMSTQGSP